MRPVLLLIINEKLKGKDVAGPLRPKIVDYDGTDEMRVNIERTYGVCAQHFISRSDAECNLATVPMDSI